nr:hypothetical protein [Tanacetum cinerariifolium]
MMSTLVFVDPESSTQADEGTYTESEPFKGKARTPKSPHIIAPPTCHVKESEGSGTSSVRSTSSYSTASLSPDHPLTHTTPALVPILRRTAHMAVCVSPAMSPGLSAGISEVAAMSDLTFYKRFRSSYDSSPSPTLSVQKRYRGMSELILGTDSEEDEEVDESSDSNSKSKGAKDKGSTVEDEDPAAGDEGLAAVVEGLGVDDESYGLDYESYGLDDESNCVDDESHGLDDEGYDVESDGLGLKEEEEAVPGGQQQAAPVVGPVMIVPLGLGNGTLRHQDLALEGDHVYSTFEVGQGYSSAPEPERSERWTSGSLTISPSPSVVTLLVSSPMIPLTALSPIASPMATSTTTIPVDEDQFREVGAQLKLYRSILQDHTHRLEATPPTLFAKIDWDVRELYIRSGAVKDEIFSQRYQFRSLKHEQKRTAMTFGALWRPVQALEAWAGCVDNRMTDMSRAGYDDHRLVHDILLQQTALQQELQEMRGHVTALKQERDRKE